MGCVCVIVVLYSLITALLHLATRVPQEWRTWLSVTYRSLTPTSKVFPHTWNVYFLIGTGGVANKIESERRVAVFLSSIGGKNYALLHDLLPQQPKDKSLDELMSTFTLRHFEPKPVVSMEHFHFHRRNRVRMKVWQSMLLN